MFYDDRPQAGGVEKPLFAVFTDSTTVQGAEVGFEQAEAVVYGAEGTQSRITAGAGSFDRASGSSTLREGVAFSSEGLEVTLPELIWDNGEREARSSGPVRIEQTGAQIEAQEFVFRPETNALRLTDVKGVFDLTAMATTHGEDAGTEEKHDAAGYGRMRIEEAGSLELVDGRPSRIGGGLALRLEAAGADPMQLKAQEARFSYADAGGPQGVVLLGGVQVDGPMGAITADAAELDLAESRYAFSGKVVGASDQAGAFEAAELTYTPGSVRMEGGASIEQAEGVKAQAGTLMLDFEANELHAETGVRVESLQGTIAAEKLQYDLETQQVAATGNVRIESDAGNVRAGAVEGNLGRNALAFTGGVSLENSDGNLNADGAVLNDRPGRMVLTGNVRGDLGGFKGIRASRIEQDTSTGDARIANLRLDSMPLPGGAGEGALSFRSAALTKAPDVRIQGGNVERITGGVALVLQPAESGVQAMHIEASQARFAYNADGNAPDAVDLEGNVRIDGAMGDITSEEATLNLAAQSAFFRGDVQGSVGEIDAFSADTLDYSPERIVLDGQVDVLAPEGHIRAARGELDPVTQNMTFTGGVRIDTETAQGVETESATFEPATGLIVFGATKAEELPVAATQRKAPVRLEPAAVADWPKLLRELRMQAASDTPSPGRHILGLLSEAVRSGIARVSLDRPPNRPTQERITEELNALLAVPEFYDPEAWRGVPLSAGTTELASQDPATLGKNDVMLRNRRLLEAAFPEAIVPYDPNALLPEGGA